MRNHAPERVPSSTAVGKAGEGVGGGLLLGMGECAQVAEDGCGGRHGRGDALVLPLLEGLLVSIGTPGGFL